MVLNEAFGTHFHLKRYERRRKNGDVWWAVEMSSLTEHRWRMEDGTWRGEGLVVLSGPSGVGKTTVERRLLSDSRSGRWGVCVEKSVSATTRAARPGEIDGVDYQFMPAEEFEAKRKRNEFLECFEVFGRGVWYGTLRSEVQAKLASGTFVLLTIDVQGGRKVIQEYPAAQSFFLLPPSMAILEQRLRGRGSDTDEEIATRLRTAQQEIVAADLYRYHIVTHDPEQVAHQILERLARSQDGRNNRRSRYTPSS